MSLSDCVKCWETPCACGWEYRDWDKTRRIKHAAMVLGIDWEYLAGIHEIPKLAEALHRIKDQLHASSVYSNPLTPGVCATLAADAGFILKQWNVATSATPTHEPTEEK